MDKTKTQMFLPFARLLYPQDAFGKLSVDLRCRSVKVNTSKKKLKAESSGEQQITTETMAAPPDLVRRVALAFSVERSRLLGIHGLMEVDIMSNS